MAGLVTEHYDFIGNHEWKVPIFLFRHHEDVERYLFALARDPTLERAVFGRFGSDFIAIEVGKDGGVVRYLTGEAKWRANLTQGTVEDLLLGKKEKGKPVRSNDGIWNQLKKDSKIPHGLRQLQRLLKDRAPADWAEAIFSLDKALSLKNPLPLPRTNLVLISGNTTPKRGKGVAWVESKSVPKEYTAPHDLQVVELFLTEGESLIDALYDALWSKEA
jgi:hypothetical protein